MRIGERQIGPEHRPLVVSDLGLAHEGHIDRALAYVEQIAETGCEAIKLQYHMPDHEMSADHPWQRTIRECNLTHEEHWRVRMAVGGAGCLYGITPFCEEAVERCVDLRPDFLKVGGAGWQHVPMLRAIGRTGLPVIMSVGCGAHKDQSALARAMDMATSNDRSRIALLWCVSRYPTAAEYADLTNVGAYNGLSDHSGLVWPGIAAAALGAEIVEVHAPADGPDARASLNTHALRQLCEGVAHVWRACRPAAATDDGEVVRLAEHRADNEYRRVG